MKAKVLGLIVAVAVLSLVAVGSAAALSSGNCGGDACYDHDALSQQPLEMTTSPQYMMCGGVGCYEVDSMTTTPRYMMCGGVGCYDTDSLRTTPQYMMCGGIGCYDAD